MFEKLILDFVVVSGLGISACHLEFGLNGKSHWTIDILWETPENLYVYCTSLVNAIKISFNISFRIILRDN